MRKRINWKPLLDKIKAMYDDGTDIKTISRDVGQSYIATYDFIKFNAIKEYRVYYTTKGREIIRHVERKLIWRLRSEKYKNR